MISAQDLVNSSSVSNSAKKYVDKIMPEILERANKGYTNWHPSLDKTPDQDIWIWSCREDEGEILDAITEYLNSFGYKVDWDLALMEISWAHIQNKPQRLPWYCTKST